MDTNVVTLITPDVARELPLMSKADVADAILDEKKMRKVSYRTITTWLVKVGLMEEEDISDGKCRKVPTASA